MFALIETHGATHIAIHVPRDAAAASLPVLAAMLEQNATFIRQGYNDASIVTPQMTIQLGDVYNHETSAADFRIEPADRENIVGDSFTLATPDVLTSNARQLKSEQDRYHRLYTEHQALKSKFDALQEQFDELKAD